MRRIIRICLLMSLLLGFRASAKGLNEPPKPFQFGSAIALANNIALIGDYGSNNFAGAVYVYRFDSSWQLQTKLTVNDSGVGDGFGYAIAFNGDTAIIGAPFRGTRQVPNQGTVYVFKYEGASWTKQAELTPSDIDQYGFWGSVIKISGNSAALTASGKNGGASAIYIFRFDGSQWVQTQKLIELPAVNGNFAGFFGSALALNSDTLAISSRSNGSGLVYIYTLIDGNWIQQQTLAPTNTDGFDMFGAALSLQDDLLLIGAPGHDAGAGSAFLYQKSSGSWIQEVEFKAADAGVRASFGAIVHLQANTILITNGNINQIEMYQFNGLQWIRQGQVSVQLKAVNLSGSGGAIVGQNDIILIGTGKAVIIFVGSPPIWREQDISSPSVSNG